MEQLTMTIVYLKILLNKFKLPDEVTKAMQIAGDLDHLLKAKDLLDYYKEEVNVTV